MYTIDMQETRQYGACEGFLHAIEQSQKKRIGRCDTGD